jgi:hypothetical protein
MEKQIFADWGIEIIERDGRIFARYDSGEIVVQFREDEITAEEALKAQKSEQDAYEVLLACQKRATPISSTGAPSASVVSWFRNMLNK